MTSADFNGRTLSVAVLTGGDSSRMGADKGLQLLAGKAMAQHVIDAVGSITDDVFIVGNDIESYRRFGLPVCSDLHDTRSSLVGVYAALAAARRENCLVVSCDMPFADPQLARLMVDLSHGYDAVVPVSPDGMEPLFALYNRRCLETMGEFIKREDFKILHVLDRLKVRWVTPAEMRDLRDPSLTFFNVNTPDDLKRAESLLVAVEAEEPFRPPADGTPLLCFVGNKNSGKTTFLAALVRHLSSVGVSVVCIKHDVHGFTMDQEGTDTFRLAEAGARQVLISAPRQFARIAEVDREMDLSELRQLVAGAADIILAEGYKRSTADKIEVHGRSDPDELVCAAEDLVALISDSRVSGVDLPVFGHGDIEAVAEFIFKRYGMQDTESGA